MREHIFYEDGLPTGGRVGKIFCDAVVEADFAFFDEHHDGGGDELLADGARLKQRIWFNGCVEFKVGEAVAFGEEDLGAMINADFSARDPFLGHFGGDVVVDGGDLRGRERM